MELLEFFFLQHQKYYASSKITHNINNDTKKKKIFFFLFHVRITLFKSKILVIPFKRIGFFLIRSHHNFGSRTSHLFIFRPINFLNTEKLAANSTANDLDNITSQSIY